MLTTSLDPSELHQKITALQKARLLRDPGTCSSWRSPLHFKSPFAYSKLENYDGMINNFGGEITCGSSFNVPSVCTNGSRNFHHSLRHHSSKIDEEDNEESVEGGYESKLSVGNPLLIESKSATCLEVPLNIHNLASINWKTPVRRTIRRLKGQSFTQGGLIKQSTASKLQDTSSISLDLLDLVETTVDTDEHNSDDLQKLPYELAQDTGYFSHSASPFFHGSGYSSKLYSSDFPRVSVGVGSSQFYSPASTTQEPSKASSWDGTAAYFDGNERDQPELSKGQRSGIPCFWSKRSKYREGWGFNPPVLSYSLKRNGGLSSGSQSSYTKKTFRHFHKKFDLSKSSHAPLLANNCEMDYSSLDAMSDGLSSQVGELDLESVFRLDGRRWSSCKSQGGLPADVPRRTDMEIPNQRNLSEKYRPMSFGEIVGQSIVIQSLGNAISSRRTAPAYLFHGPRGTGKTSAARIFSAALNCLSSAENKPCWVCQECITFSSRKGTYPSEVNAINKTDADQVTQLLKTLTLVKTVSRYKVFVIDECHLLSSKSWSIFMKFLEGQLTHIVFIFITVEPGSLPRAILSRCQKYIFSKVRNVDIVGKLRKISMKENLDVESDALHLIALNSDGSLRDAETMLDQLSLLGKRITTLVVNDLIILANERFDNLVVAWISSIAELCVYYFGLKAENISVGGRVGIMPDEKLIELLEIAMSSDTAETIRKSRELMDSGIDPINMMSQLAGLIVNMIAGACSFDNSIGGGRVTRKQELTEVEFERLQQALKILTDAEKQLKHSSERSMWFIATLLQLGSCQKLGPNGSNSSSSRGHIDKVSAVGENRGPFNKILHDSCHTKGVSKKEIFRLVNPELLGEIWSLCILRCHSNTLRRLLFDYGRLLSLSQDEGTLIAYIGFKDGTVMSRAETFLSSITNSLELVLGDNVDVRMQLMPTSPAMGFKSDPSLLNTQMEKDKQIDLTYKNDRCDPNKGKTRANGVLDSSERCPEFTHEKYDKSASGNMVYVATDEPNLPSQRKHGSYAEKYKEQEIPVPVPLKAETDEQNLQIQELQVAETGYLSKPDGVNHHFSKQSLMANENSLKHGNNELDYEFKALGISATESLPVKHLGRANHYDTSPSLLHLISTTDNFDKESMGYESGPGCNRLFCWRATKHRGKCGKAEAREISFRK